MAIPSKFIHILDIDTHDLLWTPLSPNIFVMVQCILGEKVAFQQKNFDIFQNLYYFDFSEHKYRAHVDNVYLYCPKG